MLTSNPIVDELNDAAAQLVGKGHREDAVFDAMLTATITWAVQKEGPREVSRRLYILALQAARLAEEVEGDRQTETAH